MGEVLPAFADKRFRQTKVEHLHSPFGCHLDVGRLEVPMDHSPFMCRFEGFGNLFGYS